MDREQPVPLISISIGESREMLRYSLNNVFRSGDAFVLNTNHKLPIVPVADERVIKRDPIVPVGYSFL